ncbi:MAG TPA: radical SAM protein, partial [Nitrospirae bacterium]|nr:radical SAM protein [Nitrospirota bacterium]
MAKSCCAPRDERIKIYQVDEWKVKETERRFFRPDDLLHSPPYVQKRKKGVYLFIDPESPNWISVNRAGAEILKLCNGKRTLADIQDAVSKKYGKSDSRRVRREVSDFLSAAGLLEFASETPFKRPEYTGRSRAIKPDKLEELWIYTTLACNLRCKHCLVSAGRELKGELTTDELKKLVDDAVKLGVKRFYITGGEPFIKDDIFEIIKYITKKKKRELIILTNATLFDNKNIKALDKVKGP